MTHSPPPGNNNAQVHHPLTLSQQGAKGQRLAHAPVDALPALNHVAPRLVHLRQMERKQKQDCSEEHASSMQMGSAQTNHVRHALTCTRSAERHAWRPHPPTPCARLGDLSVRREVLGQPRDGVAHLLRGPK